MVEWLPCFHSTLMYSLPMAATPEPARALNSFAKRAILQVIASVRCLVSAVVSYNLLSRHDRQLAPRYGESRAVPVKVRTR